MKLRWDVLMTLLGSGFAIYFMLVVNRNLEVLDNKLTPIIMISYFSGKLNRQPTSRDGFFPYCDGSYCQIANKQPTEPSPQKKLSMQRSEGKKQRSKG